MLVTELRGAGGTLRITDAMTLHAGADLTEDAVAARGELLRRVEALGARTRLQVVLEPHGGGELETRGAGWRLATPARSDLDLRVDCDRPLAGLRTQIDLSPGETMSVALRWGPDGKRFDGDPGTRLAGTVEAWKRWQARVRYHGPQPSLVRRAAITLKLLDHLENGAMVAAPTSSLPEAIGGARNWDYRYAWVRDVASSVDALSRIGLEQEAADFLAWLLVVVEADGGPPRMMYTLDGHRGPPERRDPALAGYRGSTPVRWGNAAGDQWQHDVFGEVLDCAYLWAKRGGAIDAALWERLRQLVDMARSRWDRPDQGIWEVRAGPRPFTYSAAMCQVAVDRGVRLAAGLGLPGGAAWRRDAERMRETLLARAWNGPLGAFAGQLDGDALDASVLALPLRRVVDANDLRMRATASAIAARLAAGGGLLYRYLPRQAPDGLPGDEGAFLLCSFWLVDNLTLQGRLDEALSLYESLCHRANALGLLPEQIDPATGTFLGNFPQAFSHVGLISSGVMLSAALEARRAGA